VIRALEVCISSGRPYSSFRKSNSIPRQFNTISIGLNTERELLYDRINLRMDKMLEAGLLQEVANVIAYRNSYALQTVGYSEVFGYMDGNYGYNEMVELLKRNSRRYAKRQLTWFKKDTSTVWFKPEEFEKIITHIHNCLNNFS
jgi:tRNA dimethylallyltransferase